MLADRRAAQPDRQDPHQHRERRRLGACRHESGDRRHRSLIDVGRPEVKWHGRHLERQPDQQQRRADENQGIDRLLAHGRECGRDAAQVEAPGGAVNQRHAVQDEPGRERAEQEILQRSLDRVNLIARQSRQDIEADGEDLEAEEQGEEVFARRHHGHAGDGEQDEGEELSARCPGRCDVINRSEDRQNGDEQKDQMEDERLRVDDQRPGEDHDSGAGPEQEDRRDRRQSEKDYRLRGRPAQVAAALQRHQEQNPYSTERRNGDRQHPDQVLREIRTHHSTHRRIKTVPRKKTKA